METVTIRIRKSDLNAIKRAFPSYKGETQASYFFRLNLELQKQNGRRRN